MFVFEVRAMAIDVKYFKFVLLWCMALLTLLVVYSFTHPCTLISNLNHDSEFGTRKTKLTPCNKQVCQSDINIKFIL